MAEVQTSGGLGLSGTLTMIFVVLKLVGTINWSWWWVLSPLWIGAGLIFSILFLFFIGVMITKVFK